MRDQQLAKIAREWKELDLEIKEQENERDKLKQKILKEMERRETQGITTHGVRISYVQQKPLVYDPVKLRRRLSKEDWMRITERTLSIDKLSAAVQSGDVDVVKVNRCAEEKPKAPYPQVTFVES